jgi:hypothetical protein
MISIHPYRRLAGLVLTALAPIALPADDAGRISRLETEIQQLRSQIDEQNRRIERLEAELARRAGASPAEPVSKARQGAERVDKPVPVGRQPWHSADAWKRIIKGMTTEQVTAILGEPTSVESIPGLKTLFYRGATTAGVHLSGLVNFRDERVVAVNVPKF